MKKDLHSPLGAIARGLVAGALGTGAMTLHQTLVSELRSSRSSDGSSSKSKQGESWESAPAPAVVAKRILEGVFRRNVPAQRIGLLTNAMHWAYGTGWGAVYGLVEGTVRASPLAAGPLFGGVVWAASYAQLVPMGLYEPPWTYPVKTLANDLGYHVTYGLGVALGYAALDRG